MFPIELFSAHLFSSHLFSNLSNIPNQTLSLHIVAISDRLGLNQNTILRFNNVHQILSMPFSNLITTSGHLHVNNLNEVIDIIINNYSNRKVDWVITFEGDVVAIIHTNDTVIYT